MSLDRFTGALLGLALGDALGATYEFRRPPFEVAREFGTGVFGTAPGHPTDDSTLAAHCAGRRSYAAAPTTTTSRSLGSGDRKARDVLYHRPVAST